MCLCVYLQINTVISGCTIADSDGTPVAQKAGSDGNICPAVSGVEQQGGADPCDGKAAGDACSIHGSSTGACGGDPLACVDDAVCAGVADNAHCTTDSGRRATGAAQCVPAGRVTRFCADVQLYGDTPEERAAVCTTNGDCEYSEGSETLGIPETCQSKAISACAGDFTDEASCQALYTTLGPDVDPMSQVEGAVPGCEYKAADSTVIVHINTVRWSNYIKWELQDFAGAREAYGPKARPIYLGGTPGGLAGQNFVRAPVDRIGLP